MDDLQAAVIAAASQPTYSEAEFKDSFEFFEAFLKKERKKRAAGSTRKLLDRQEALTRDDGYGPRETSR